MAKAYDRILSNNEKVTLLNRDYDAIVPHIFPVRIKGLSNYQNLKDKLLKFGIETGKHYQPNHLLSYYKKLSKKKLPITEKIFPELITLPLHPDLSNKDVNYVCQSLDKCIN